MARSIVAAAASVVALAACASGCVHKTTSAAAPTDPFLVCETAGMDASSARYVDRSRGWSGNLAIGLPKGGGAIGASRDRSDVELSYEGAERAIPVDPALDALHRNVISSCKAYALCVQKNGYVETFCRRAMAKWRRAENILSDYYAGRRAG